MEMIASAPVCRHHVVRIATRRHSEFVDVTERLRALVADAGLRAGFVNVQSLHTTAAVVVNEHEPLLLDDFDALLERAAPRGGIYAHDDPRERTVNITGGERINGHGHCRALLLGASAGLNVVDGALELGRWQRVFLAEMDGPQERQLSVVIVGESAR